MKKFRRIVSTLLAAVIAASGQLSGTASAAEKTDLPGRIADINAARTEAIEEYRAQTYTQGTAAAKVLCVLFSDVYMHEDSKKTKEVHAVLERDSDEAKVLNYAFKRFEDAVYDYTDGALKAEVTQYWYEEPVDIRSTANSTLIMPDAKLELAFPPEYDPENYDFVLGFSGRTGPFDYRGLSALGLQTDLSFHNYGYAYVQIPDLEKELKLAEADAPLEEIQKTKTTAGVMIHEWMHQIDNKLDTWFHERFPDCHAYQPNDGSLGGEADSSKYELIYTEEDGVRYVTNSKNGFQWEFDEDKYAYDNSYYKAFLNGEIIDTKQDNRKTGMFPALWKALLKGDELGNYTLLNTETGNYLYLENKNAEEGVVPIPFSPGGPLPSNVIWNLRMDTTTDWYKQMWPEDSLPYPFEDGDAVALVNRQSLRSAVLEMHTEQTDNLGNFYPAKPLYSVPIVDRFFTADKTTFGFLPLPTEDGNCQLKSNLKEIGDTMLSVSGKTVNNEAENPNSTWKIEEVKPVSESYVIRNSVSGKCLNANTSPEKSEALILTRNSQGYYTIQSNDKKQSLTVKDGQPKADGAVTFAKTAAGSSAQLWELLCTPDGSYQIASAANKSLFLDWDAETGKMTLQKGADSEKRIFEIREPFSAEHLEKLFKALLADIDMNELDSSYDLNRDGKVNAVDLTLLKRYLLS